MSADARPLLRDSQHLRLVVIAIRKRNCENARRAFERDCAGSIAALLDAQEKYISALEVLVADLEG